MARTERRTLFWDEDCHVHIDPNGRDRKTQCWCCSKWKRPERRRDRHRAKDAIRRTPEEV